MRRHLLNLLTALSLLLSVTVVALWVRSHRTSDTLMWQISRWRGGESWEARQYVAKSVKGTWVFGHQMTDSDVTSLSPTLVEDERQRVPNGWQFFHNAYRGTPKRPYSTVTEPVNSLGFGIERRSGTHPPVRIEWRAVKLPAYLPFILTALLPSVWLYRTWGRRRRRGQCAT